MSERDYASEDLLQELLAKYRNLLGGDQIDSDEPRHWLLVSRDSEEDGAGWWSWITCSSIKMRFQLSSRSNAALIPASGAKWSARCSTTLPTRWFTGPLKRFVPVLKKM